MLRQDPCSDHGHVSSSRLVKRSVRISRTGEVVYPTAQNRIDELHHRSYGLGVETQEEVLEVAQQCGALLELGRIVRSPFTLKTPHPPELKAQKSEALSLRQVNKSTLLFVVLSTTLSMGFRSLVSLLRAIQATRLLALCLGGTVSH